MVVLNSVLSLRRVTAGYGGTIVLRDVSLEVPRSSVVALLGPNGAGKTTLLRVASGLLRTASGEVVFKDEAVTVNSAHKLSRRGLCHVPEGRGIFPSLTVKENLYLFAAAGQERNAVAEATSAFPRLASRLNQVAGSLSGGEQQMLALVRAYISSPSLVLVDEASMGLAPTLVDSLFEFLSTISRTGTSLLIVEQYVHRALAIADQVYVLNRGTIVYQGLARQVADDELTRSYLGMEMPI